MKHFKATIKENGIDGVRIKSDTWYNLENGKFVEVEE